MGKCAAIIRHHDDAIFLPMEKSVTSVAGKHKSKFAITVTRIDNDGFIFIVEREREMIKSGGNRVGAKEIEEVIAELTDVVEVAVVGVPDEILGEAIVAVVAPVKDSGMTHERVKEHCRGRLPAYKGPAVVRIVSQLPHNKNGKVVKSALRAGS